MIKKLANNTIVRLIFGVLAGLLIGPYLNDTFLQIILSTKHILGQLILFLVPLIILGFIVSAIANLEQKSSSIIGVSLLIAYLSSVGAGFFSASMGYTILPHINIVPTISELTKLPAMLFKLDIPPIFDVMTSLVLALMIGLGILWTNAKPLAQAFNYLKDIVSLLVSKILMPILPVYIACNFALLSYAGTIKSQLPIFIKVIVIVILLHLCWIAILYGIAGLYSRKNPWNVLKHYGPTYITALGTMSSAASLGIALQAANKSKILKPEISNFTIPFFSNVHLCGAMVTEIFFVLTVSMVLYGVIPEPITVSIFILLLGIFALGAPGVPGGTLMASLGLITQLIGFDDVGIALILTIFALQDSFGTACNIVGDGALTLIINTYHDRTQKKEEAL